MNTSDSPRLHVGHWHNECLVSHDHPAPQRAQAQLDRVARQLADELASGLHVWFREAGDRVIVIRRLECDVELDLSCDTALLASRWAHRFARTLAAAIDGGEQMLSFPDAATYRARFIVDLAHGRAWDAWYYPGFAGLRVLPVASAIRTVLLEDVALGHATLRALPHDAWPALCAVLTGAEAGRIVQTLCCLGSGTPLDTDALRSTLQQARQMLPPGAPHGACALAVLVAAMQRHCAATEELALWADTAARLLALSDDAGALRAVLSDRNDGAGGPAARALWYILQTRPVWRDALSAALPGSPAHARSLHAATAARHTAFAGMALLLTELDELLDAGLSAVLPPGGDFPMRALTGWLALCHAAGATRCRHMMDEPFWRDFFALPDAFTPDEAIAAFHGHDPAPALAALVRRADARARGEALHAPLLCAPQRRWLRVDTATGIWCEWLGDVLSPAPPPDLPALRRTARRPRRDWRDLDARLPLSDGWQRFIVQLAQIALRRFAWRIPGFARSSLPFLRDNFLTGAGQCDAADGLPLTLSLTRPPLHALLNLTGVARSNASWSGPPARALQLDYLP